MSVFVYAQGIKTVHAGEGGSKMVKFCPCAGTLLFCTLNGSRNLVREIWFEKSGSRNLVPEIWFQKSGSREVVDQKKKVVL